jgi:7,8-dihydropterin-6-yl-methyl-4-(beta-D-ribofuranosyl)aminobenzene 5'-phosphate synthase
MTTEAAIGLKEVDSVEITTVMDNYVDVFLDKSSLVARPPLAIDGDIPVDDLVAEHGLSLLITVKRGQDSHCILFDCGHTRIGVPHNLRILDIDLQHIEAIVLSHGHVDHTGALYAVAESLGRPIPIIVHPDALLHPRFFGLEDGTRLKFPQTMVKEEINRTGLNIVESKSPSLLADDMIAVTGEVERKTSFEKGLPNATIERDGELEPDPILDDQALVVRLREKGLVIIAGCSHAGIINTVFYARRITGTDKIHAVLGGFHLQGPAFEPVINDTFEEFKKMNPEVIVPMHCTGWNTIHRFSEEFPSSFILNSVGSRITLS